jgi:hypothetical protein
VKQPLGVTCLIVFFMAATAISAAAAVSLLWPEGPLDQMWRINPRAREELVRVVAVVLRSSTAQAILEHLRLPSRPIPLAGATSAPQLRFW